MDIGHGALLFAIRLLTRDWYWKKKFWKEIKRNCQKFPNGCNEKWGIAAARDKRYEKSRRGIAAADFKINHIEEDSPLHVKTKAKLRRGIGAEVEDNFWNHKFENLRVWTCSVEERLMKQKAINVLAAMEIFFIFLNFLRREMRSGREFLQASRGWKAAHPKVFDRKSADFDGSRMLRYGVISDWKIEFLQAEIENLSVFCKNFNYRWWFLDNFSQILIVDPKP